MLDWIAGIVTTVINILYDFTKTIGFPNYALAIVMISILMKIILYPLMRKQMKSTMGMQEVQPKVMELQKKYKNNPEKLNQEVMELYKEYDVNPMAGCLPLLIQLPILYGFFSALRGYTFPDAENAGFFWIQNIANPDPIFILPLLVGVTMFLQQKFMMPQVAEGNAQATQMMKMMLYFMPVLIAFTSTQFPAGMCIYWITFSILSIIQQFFLNKEREKQKAIRAQKEAERRAEMERKKEEERKKGQNPSKKKKKNIPKAEYKPKVKEENEPSKE